LLSASIRLSISGVTGAITRLWNLDPNGLGITVSAALAGTILGAMLASLPGDRIGAATAFGSWRSSISSRRSAARWRGTGFRWCSSA